MTSFLDVNILCVRIVFKTRYLTTSLSTYSNNRKEKKSNSISFISISIWNIFFWLNSSIKSWIYSPLGYMTLWIQKVRPWNVCLIYFEMRFSWHHDEKRNWHNFNSFFTFSSAPHRNSSHLLPMNDPKCSLNV